MTMRHCQSRRCLVQHFCLDHVQKYVDPRSHLVQGELRYSIEQRVYDPERVKFVMKWQRRVLGNTQMNQLFQELNHE